MKINSLYFGRPNAPTAAGEFSFDPGRRRQSRAGHLLGPVPNRRDHLEEAQDRMLNILSVDVEEYFHPTEIALEARRWSSMTSRVEAQTRHVLDLMAEHGVRATFFVLGWVAERQPQLIQQIADAGHEIGCHSYAHRLVYALNPDEFRRDTQRAVAVIQDACGIRPRLYRAPSYSITAKSLWALDILVECGFTHDSSIYPISHDRYGIPSFSRSAQIVRTAAGDICEVPIATVQLSRGTIAPIGGGGYMRLLPYRYTAAGIRRLNRIEKQPACIYFHPWELDPAQPRLTNAFLARLRTYRGLEGMSSKVDRLISDFKFSTMTAVHAFCPLGRAEQDLPQLSLAASVSEN
jgi:polysaccharide deacetylase family protein (PEP-CTERM system associated)